MVKPIMKDIFFLQQKSEPATAADVQVMRDLTDTLQAHRDECVGMAANMIGVKKRIIAISIGPIQLLMVNPKILQRSNPYEAEEGCLSLSGVRKTTRYDHIEVQYQDQHMEIHQQSFSGWTAQIIQHEVDHCDGILI